LQEGDVVSLRDLLYCALMSSDNVAATALAHHVGRRLPNPTRLDPVGNFVAHMNALARNLRMRRTLFLNPHGIDSMQGTLPVSTALDMARLTRYAYTDGDFRFFVSQRTREIDVLREGQRMSVTLRNTNQLLGQDGIDGVKTGFTNRAGYCLIVSSWKNPEVIRRGDSVVQNQRRLIVVVLGAHTNEARFSEGLRFIRTGWSLYDQWARAGRVVNKKDTL
jgi:D-alanyl-D-alanine carboxypeptidase